jgi:selenium-binding protein 1
LRQPPQVPNSLRTRGPRAGSITSEGAPFVTDINLSLDDRFLYVSCWGTGEFIQCDVSDTANPKKTGSVHLGGIVRCAAHPIRPKQPLNGGPQMVEVSRDGKRVYFTNSLYSSWDDQIYPDGLKSWMIKLDADPNGGMKLDEKFFVEFDELLRKAWLNLNLVWAAALVVTSVVTLLI